MYIFHPEDYGDIDPKYRWRSYIELYELIEKLANSPEPIDKESGFCLLCNSFDYNNTKSLELDYHHEGHCPYYLAYIAIKEAEKSKEE